MEGGGATQKRTRPAARVPALGSSGNAVIILSDSDDSDARPVKRLKSTPPVRNGVLNGLPHHNAQPGSSVASSAKSRTSTPFEPQPRESREVPSHSQQGLKKSSGAWGREQNSEQRQTTSFSKGDKDGAGLLASVSKSKDTRGGVSSDRGDRSTEVNQKSRSRTPLKMGQSTSSGSTGQRAVERSVEEPSLHVAKKQEMDAEVISSSDSEDEADEEQILQNFKATKAPKPQRPAPPQQPTSQPPQPQYSSTPKPNFNLSVPIRPSPSPQKTHLTRPVTPPRSSYFQVVVPLSKSKETKARKRQEIFPELEKSTDFAKQHPSTTERYFGQNGFSAAFSANDIARKIAAGPVYKRKVDRSKVKLDWGPPPPEYFDPFGNPRPRGPHLHPKEMVKIILQRRFDEYDDLDFVNDIDDRQINGKFQFIDGYIIRPGVKQASEEKNRGCGCVDVCSPSECSCLIKSITTTNPTNGGKSTTSYIIRTYIPSPTVHNTSVLDPAYIANELKPEAQHYEITECNALCGCGPTCWNRVVGRGRTVPLQIYMTERCGFGVRSTVDIPKGQFIDLYLGEVITSAEVEKRERAKHPEASSYIYSLDWFKSVQNYHVDGEWFGSAMRFVNHCCSPNARCFTVQTHQGDKNVYNLAFFAIRDIPAGEQITIDYSPQESLGDVAEDLADLALQPDPAPVNSTTDKGKGKESTPGSNDDASVSSKCKGRAVELPGPIVEDKEDDGRSRCYCGAPNCRKYLWRGPGRQRRKKKTARND